MTVEWVEPNPLSKKDVFVEQRTEQLLEEVSDLLDQFGLDEDCVNYDLVKEKFEQQAGEEWEEAKTQEAIERWENGQGWSGADY